MAHALQNIDLLGCHLLERLRRCLRGTDDLVNHGFLLLWRDIKRVERKVDRFHRSLLHLLVRKMRVGDTLNDGLDSLESSVKAVLCVGGDELFVPETQLALHRHNDEEQAGIVLGDLCAVPLGRSALLSLATARRLH